MTQRRASIWSRVLAYTLTVLVVALAAVLRAALDRAFGGFPPYITFYPVVVLTALLGGLGAGLTATALSAVVCWVVFLPPAWSLSLEHPGEAAALAFYCSVSTLVAWVAHELRRSLIQRKETEVLLRQRQQELEQVQGELRQRVEEMQTLMQVLPVGVFMAQDRQCSVITANPAGHEMLRMPVGTNLSASAPAGQRPAFVTIRDGQPLPPEQLPMQLAASRGIEVQDAEVRHLYSDGTVVDFFGSAVPLRDAHGSVRGAVGVFVDITGRKQAEEALRGFFNASAVYMAIAELEDVDLRCVLANAKMAEWFGQPVDYVTGRRASELGLSGADLANAMSMCRQCHEAKAPLNFEYRLTYAGREAWYYTTISPIAGGAAGRPRFALASIEITERKRAEAALHRYQILAGSSRDIILFMDRDTGRILDANAAAVQAYGYTHEELLALSIHQLRESSTLNTTAEQMEQADREGILFETMHRRKDGSVFPVEVSSRGATVDGRRMLVSVVRDITERRRTQQALEDANAAKDQFMAVLSHELRTPLNPVLMAVTAMEQDPALPPQFREDLQMICRNIELEARLIDDLLDITRITRGKLSLERRPVSVFAVIRDAAQTCMSDARDKGLQIVERFCEEELFVNGDATRLQQVVWNLLKNAIKFTASGEIVLTCNREGEQVVIAVRDHGIGIEPEQLHRIFNAFDQGDAATMRRFGGLGLGLAITRALVEMHDGTVIAHSEGRGTGATFTVRLPLTASSMTVGDAAVQDAPAIKAHALLVEDHADSARVLMMLLRRQGLEVRWAGTVAQGLAAAREDRFDILISDISLPDGTGLDLARQLLREQPHLKAIALSGHGSESDTRQSRDAGFAMHLVKPVNPQQLRQAIGRVLAEPARIRVTP